jgi:hypothetical protein
LTASVQASGWLNSGGENTVGTPCDWLNSAPVLFVGLRAMFHSAWKVSPGFPPRGGVASARNRASTPYVPRTHAATRLASERVERSALVASALGGLSSTGDGCPVSGSTRLSFIPAAMRSPKAFPAIFFPSLNCAMLNAAATVVSSLMTTCPSGIRGPMTATSSTRLLTAAVA